SKSSTIRLSHRFPRRRAPCSLVSIASGAMRARASSCSQTRQLHEDSRQLARCAPVAASSRRVLLCLSPTSSASSFPAMPHFYYEPTVTLLARPSFSMPAHLPVNWIGESTDGERLAEFAGRVCYMSQHNPAKRTTRDYLENIKKQGHGSVLEHANYTLFVEGVSRSLTHELVRHRAGFAYSQ